MEASPYGHITESGLSDSNKVEPIGANRPIGGPKAVSGPGPVRPAEPPSPVAEAAVIRDVGPIGAVMATLAAGLDSGTLDRPGAVRALVGEIVLRELGPLDTETRARMVDEVVELLGEEPAWQARLDGLWSAPR